ncbi:hypothetical protein CHELA1G11_21681 [Hyphomicrobiales bacterium]|nr:hypothetical protein CHELA1G11_21681 [Hyphomicrobiales bacterium]CAH1695440.1 hypothetical protein CHELA1G2_21986 [Hyphomicrobiales bacterium]
MLRRVVLAIRDSWPTGKPFGQHLSFPDHQHLSRPAGALVAAGWAAAVGGAVAAVEEAGASSLT